MKNLRSIYQVNLRYLFVLCAAFGLSVSTVNAQFNSGIQGTVQDSANAVVANATVRVRNVENNVSQETISNESGYFRFLSLQPGDYEVVVEAQGFGNQTQTVNISTGQSREISFSLLPQGATATVDVTTEAPLLDTADNRVQLTLESETIRDLPLRNNNIFQIIALAPGVTGTNGATDNFAPESNSGISANGRSARGNSFNVDGLNVSSNITNGTTNLSPNPDTIEELVIETNTFRADQAASSGVVVNVTTKSGTNDLHGSGTFYYTDNKLRARQTVPFQAEVAPFARRNFSAAIGGPVILPAFNEGGPLVYDGRNKTFFFFGIERLRAQASENSNITYESPEFVDLLRQRFPNSTGVNYLATNPSLGVSRTSVAQTAAQFDFGLQDPSQNESATNPRLTCTTLGIPCDLPVLLNGSFSRSPSRNGLQYSIRGDQYIGDNNRIYGSYYRAQSNDQNLNPRPTLTRDREFTTDSFQGNWTHNFNATTLNEFSFSGNKVLGTEGGAPYRLPNLAINALTGQGDTFGGTFVQHNYNFRDVVTLVRGNHTLKIGGTYQQGDDFAEFANGRSRPFFFFDSLYNLGRDLPRNGDYGAYDPLTGQPKEYTFGAKINQISAYVQDEWKVRPNLTLTLSLRWDDFGNPKAIKGFLMTNLFPQSDGETPEELVPNAAVRRVDQPFEGRLNKNFAPRFGFAYSPGSSNRTSIRGGIGVYYDAVTLGEVVDRVNENPPNFVFPNFGVGQNSPFPTIFSIGTSDTFPYGFNRPNVPANSLDQRGGIVGLNTSIGGLDPNLKAPLALNYAIGVEHQIFGRTVVGVNYTGSRGYDGLVGGDYNRFPGDLLDGDLDRLNPSFGSIQYITNANKSRYNALITSVRTQLSTVATFQASYTFSNVKDFYQGGTRTGVSSEGIDDVRNIRARFADSNYDVRHRFSASGIYRVPALFNDNFVGRYLLGGWEVGTSIILQTGTPFSVFTNNADFNRDGNFFEFLDQPTGLARRVDRNTILADGGRAFNVADFPAPTTVRSGNGLRNYFRQQGFAGVDASLIKNIALPFINERGNLQLRGEFFNIFNRVNLGGVNNNIVDTANFGRITSQADPRVVQIGLRFAF